MLWLTPATSQWKAIPHLQVSLQFPAFPYFSVERNPEISATDPDPQSPSCQPSLVIQLKATCIINVLRQLVVSLLNFICICYCLIQNLTNRKKDWSCMTAKIAQWLGTKRGGGGGGWCYWGLCIYLTGLNICPDNVYCDIQTEGRWLRPRNSLFAKRNRPTQKYNANVSWYHHLCLPR